MRTRRLALERRLAPHVDPAWTERVLLELRLRDIPGTAIGAALAEVDSHCAESGEPAAEAFGDPVAYARSLDLPAGTSQSARGILVDIVPTALQTLGLLGVVWALPDLLTGEPLTFTVGSAAFVALLTAELLLLARFADPLLATLVRKPVVSWSIAMLALAAPVLLFVLLPAPLATVPAVSAVVGGVLLLAVGTTAAWRNRSTTVDPVVSPTGAGSDTRVARVVAAGTVWFIPAGTVVLAATTWLLTAMT